MREVRDSGKVVGLDRIAVMVALNLANELLQLKSRDVKVESEAGAKVRNMRERVEAAACQAAKQLGTLNCSTSRGCPGWCRVEPGVACGVRQLAGLPLEPNLNTPGHMGLRAALCKSAPCGKPYLPWLVPLVALVREQRFAPAPAGDVLAPAPRV